MNKFNVLNNLADSVFKEAVLLIFQDLRDGKYSSYQISTYYTLYFTGSDKADWDLFIADNAAKVERIMQTWHTLWMFNDFKPATVICTCGTNITMGYQAPPEFHSQWCETLRK